MKTYFKESWLVTGARWTNSGACFQVNSFLVCSLHHISPVCGACTPLDIFFGREGYFSNQLKLFSIICKNFKISTYCTENLFRLDLLIWTTWSFRQFIYLYLVAYTWIFTLYHPNTRLWLMTLAASVWGLR